MPGEGVNLKFEIDLEWELEEGVTVSLTVGGTYESQPEMGKRGPVDCAEAAWSTFDVESVVNEKGTPLPAAIVERLSADGLFLNAVERKIFVTRT